MPMVKATDLTPQKNLLLSTIINFVLIFAKKQQKNTCFNNDKLFHWQ